ncbi:cupin domain-containing protein [Haliea sp. E17]|uniref:cupin domain-containing protein n=1 Tax=Haliea sp. E17 TaxID=3401576 RepID=UPI003AAD7209
MRNLKTTCLGCLLAVALSLPASARAEAIEIAPAADRERAQALGAYGPVKSQGIAAAEVMGSMPLDADFPALEGYVMRARRITVLPGGVVGVHQHAGRPGVLYMLEGEMSEIRSDQAQPNNWSAGEMTFESHGTIHWWRNDGETSSVAFVVDIVPADPQ